MESTLWCPLIYKSSLHVVFSLKCAWLVKHLIRSQEFHNCASCRETSNYTPQITLLPTINVHYYWGNVTLLYINIRYLVETQSVSYSHVDTQNWHQIPELSLDWSSDVCWADTGKVNAILEGAHSLCIFRSVAFIKCNGGVVNYEWRTTLWTMRMMQIIHPCFLWKPLLSRGISHQRDEDCIPHKCKVSRLQAAASECYHHLDYGLDQGFPNFLMSKTSTSIYIQPQARAW